VNKTCIRFGLLPALRQEYHAAAADRNCPCNIQTSIDAIFPDDLCALGTTSVMVDLDDIFIYSNSVAKRHGQHPLKNNIRLDKGKNSLYLKWVKVQPLCERINLPRPFIDWTEEITLPDVAAKIKPAFRGECENPQTINNIANRSLDCKIMLGISFPTSQWHYWALLLLWTTKMGSPFMVAKYPMLAFESDSTPAQQYAGNDTNHQANWDPQSRQAHMAHL